MNNSRIPETSIEWFEWLQKEEGKTRAAYLAKPVMLVSDYNKEIATTKDYEGREILELLQNAADQACEAEVRGLVIVEVMPEGLVVANSGAAFSIGGVSSLETANLSPKRHKRQQFIGNKGLGFRSVLNWTHEPMILSGTLGLAYSKVVSEQKLKALVAESTELADLVSVERRSGEQLIIPVLPFPGYRADGAIKEFVGGDVGRLVLQRCRSWRETEYSTAIGMPFARSEFFDAACQQIDALRPEILLFVDHLDEVRFISPDSGERIWSLDGSDHAAMVSENGEPLGIWQIHRDRGKIPSEKLDPDQTGPLNYEVIVAVPEVEDFAELKSSALFSHFPTEISFPLPVVCHASLELNQSRNHTQQRSSNRFVLEQLAEHLAAVAERRAATYPMGPKAGYRMLMALGEFSSDLVRENFPEYLLSVARQRSIVPTLSGNAVVSSRAFLVPGANSSWLPVSGFPDVVPIENDDEAFFESLGVSDLDVFDLKKRILALNDLSMSERVALIEGLIENQIETSAHTSSLLLDASGEKVPDGSATFISPASGEIPVLPPWMMLRFLNKELHSRLIDRLQAADVRDLQRKLSSFGLLEYSLANLIRRLIAVANQEKKMRPDIATEIDHDLLVTVFSLYKAEGLSGKRPIFPDKVNLLIPNQVGKSMPASQLYLGAGFGSEGEIVQALYASWASEKLAVSPGELGLECEENECSEFLQWLGVAKWPREISVRDPRDGFREHVLHNISYPAIFSEYSVDSYEFTMYEDVSYPAIEDIRTIDGLMEIITKADAVAISSWLTADVRAVGWNKDHFDNATLSALRGYDRKRRVYEGIVPNYVRWKIESTEWLLDKDEKRHRPKDCVIGQRAAESLFPRPAKPDKRVLEHYGVQERDLIEGWRRAGVLISLVELDLDDIYARLIELPIRQPGGGSARSLYHWLLDAADSAVGDGGLAKRQFFKEGKMWGHKQNKFAYFPVSELRYADTEGLPDALLNRLNLVDLRHRSGAEKVKRIFGINPIERTAINQCVKHHKLAVDLDPEFQKAKPYLYLLRASQNSQMQYLSDLKKLHLNVCEELTADMEYLGESFEFLVPEWGWLIDEDVLYVRSDLADSGHEVSDLLADSVGEAIASIFRVGDGGDFARMFRCKNADRKKLLNKMRGEAAEEDMEQIIQEFGTLSPLERVSLLPPHEEIIEPEQTNSAPDPIEDDGNDSDGDVTPSLDEEYPPSDHDQPLAIKPCEHVPAAPPKPRKLNVRRTTGEAKQKRGGYVVTDGDFAERKVIEFEEAAIPPRFPLPVGHLTGADAPGCDVLCFASAEDREDFRSGQNRRLDKIVRFVEVKGRKNEGASIELRGNERATAVEHDQKYFIYRLYESGPGDYQLSILRAPLDQEEALEKAVYVNLDRANTTERFSLSGGIQPDSHSDDTV